MEHTILQPGLIANFSGKHAVCGVAWAQKKQGRTVFASYIFEKIFCIPFQRICLLQYFLKKIYVFC